MKRYFHTLKAVILPAILLMAAVACERKGVHNIIPERTMSDVLYDYQLAVALADAEMDNKQVAEKEYLYTQAVFRKYGITAEEFDLSVAHYARDPKTMLKITDKVCERYSEEIREGTDREKDEETLQRGVRYDTVMVWKLHHDVMLSAAGRNRYEVEIPHKQLKRGARLMVGFNTSWAYREGSKQGYYQIAVTYANDSTYTQGQEIREYDAKQGLSVFLSDHYDVRRVSLYIYQDAQWRPFPQMLCLNNLRAWSITSQIVDKKENGKKDTPADSGSTPAPEGRSHLAKPDTLP